MNKVRYYPKLCLLKKKSDGYGFHLNGEVGKEGQFLKKVVPGGSADEAGVVDGNTPHDVAQELITNVKFR